MWLAGGRWAWFGVVRLAASVLRRIWVCCPVRWVRLPFSGLPSLGASASVPCPLGVLFCRGAPGSAGWGGEASSVWRAPPPSCLPPPCRPSCLVSRPCPLSPPVSVPLCLCGGPCSGRRPGSGLVVRVRWRVVRCSRRFPVWVYPPPPAWGPVADARDPVWFVRCGVWVAVARHGRRAPLGWSVLCPAVAVSLCGLAVLTGCSGGGGCRSWRCGASLLRGCVSWRVSLCPPLSLVEWPLRFPSPSVGFLRQCYVAWCPVPVGACPSPCPFLLPLAAGLPFALSLLRCPGGGVVGRSVGRRWPMPGGGRPGATGGGLRGLRGDRGPEPRPGGGFSMPSAACWPQGWCCRGRQGCG